MLITLKTKDRCIQLPVITNTTQPVGLSSSGIELEPSASLLGKPTRAVVLGDKLQVAPLDLPVVFVDVLDAKIRDRNASRDNFQVILLGNFLPQSVPITTTILSSASQSAIKLPLHFVIELHTDDSVPSALNFIAHLVVEPVEIGVVESFLGLFKAVVSGLARIDDFASR